MLTSHDRKMGKPRSLSKKAKTLAKKKGLVSDDGQHQYSIDQILDKAESFIEEYNYEMAQKFCQRALEMDADNIRALETCASLLLEAGDVKNAKHCLGRAVTVQPDEGHSKFLSLAQLFDGKESLQLYLQGIKIMTGNPELKRDTSSAFCSVADLYMTDLCDEPDAESECSNAIENALKADETNPEAWQTKARFQIVKSQFEDARGSIKHSLSLWLPSYEAVLENRSSEAASAEGGFDPVEVCPLLYTTRIAASKMLIELEEWDLASKVLDGLLEEDDEVVETWYLLGWLNRLRATLEKSDGEKNSENSESKIRLKPSEIDPESDCDGFNSNARYYLTQAQKVHTSKKPTDDEEMIKHIAELLEELGPGEPEPEGEAPQNEDEWETDEEEETMDQN